MNRVDFFGFRVNDAERSLISTLAERLQRSESDAIRFVIREAVKALDADTPIASPPAGTGEASRERPR